jgi:hypothetical protein
VWLCKKKSIEKMDKCLRYLKQWVLRCSLKKRKREKEKRKKDSPCSLAKVFQVSNKRDMFQGA